MPTRRRTKYYIGIDIGEKGAVSILTENSTEVYDSFAMPTIGNTVDAHKLVDLLKFYRGQECHVVFEDLHAIFGSSAKSNHSFGRNDGIVRGIVAALNLPFTPVEAKVWQKEMFVGVKKLLRKSSSGKTMVNDTKKMALIACKRLFPTANLLATKRSSVPHNGIVDSVLMAEYCKRKFK
jgi:hypothetical protein